MKNTAISLMIFFSLFTFSCKKSYDYNVEYKVTLVPYSGQTNYTTDIEYITKDNAIQKISINSTQWGFSFKGKEDDNAFLKGINLSNGSTLKIEIIINGTSYKNECNTSSCSVELKKALN